MSKLHEALTGIGLDMSLNTLKNYSTKYLWQQNAGRYDQRNLLVEQSNLADTMNERHILLGRAMQSLAEQFLQTADPAQLTAGDAVRPMKVGVDIERLTMGVATARMEVFTEFMSSAVVDIVKVFHTINMIEDPEAGRREWAERSLYERS